MKSIIRLFITAIVLLVFPNINYGQAPDLGSASGFALFTASGAFTNTGIATSVAGDIGTNVGALTGFPPGIVIGQIHVADANSALAATAVDNAYTYLSGLGGADLEVGLGNGQILTPGIYST
ncbi:MAG: hypothetical protein HGB12_13165, partial [Bacteroidetes bacterium]|nr:hypothetical protein [Bacteroidota bacterium]